MAEEQATAAETEIDPGRAADLAASGEAVLIDIRTDHEWRGARARGARHIEINALPRQAESLPRDRMIVLYCRSGNRSATAAEAFRGAGYDAFNLAGGLLAWAERGLPLEPPDGEVVAPLPAPP